ncbi:hypothetical protein BHE74_00034777 [Ensete ventricosum]|nr:hypothetical protein BHE74_00034777 [Ensete ventricosum]
MLARWGRAASQLAAAAELTRRVAAPRAAYLSDRSYSKVGTAASAAAATVTAPSTPAASSPSKRPLNKPEVTLNVMFWSKACPLALPPNSPLRLEEPHYEGIKRVMLKLLLFYSKQSKSIRGANVVYRRIISQVDKPAIYDGVPSFSFFVYWFCFYYSDMVKSIFCCQLYCTHTPFNFFSLKLKILSTHILFLICSSSYYLQSFYISLFQVWIT